MVVGELGTNGGLWCSPEAKTSRPTSSAFLAMATMDLIRPCSVGTQPVVGSGVTSPMVKTPNCMLLTLQSLCICIDPRQGQHRSGPGIPAVRHVTGGRGGVAVVDRPPPRFVVLIRSPVPVSARQTPQ